MRRKGAEIHMEGQLPDPSFEELRSLLDLRRWAEAIVKVRERLEAAATPERRSFYHLFLASIHKHQFRGAIRRGDAPAVAGFALDVEGAYRSAIRENGRDVTPRISLAEFHLRHREIHPDDEALLRPFAAEDFAFHRDLVRQDHKRLVLLGVLAALRGDLDRAADSLFQAYGERFQRSLTGAYKTPLWLLSRRGIRLPSGTALGLIRSLAGFQTSNPAGLARLQAALDPPSV